MTASKINTLVIGGSGFIGSSILQLLVNEGRQVTVMGRNPPGNIRLPLGVNYIQGDYSSSPYLSQILSGCKEVVFLAYATIPNTSYENPLGDLIDNLPGAIRLFSEASKLGVKLILLSSGGAVYGEAIHLPILESHPTKPISPYGVTKLTLEGYAHYFAKIHGLKYVCLRPGNPYGATQHPFRGQGFIATAVGSILRGRPVCIYGNHGTIRDYIYIDDLARGIVSALMNGEVGETYNIGSGVGASNLDVLDLLAPIMNRIGFDVSVEHLQDRPFDVKTNILDSTKLEKRTGWIASVSLETGLNYMVESMISLQ